MSTENFFYNLYSKKNSEELEQIAMSDCYTSDAKLCAISILKERDISVESLIPLESDLIEQRDQRVDSELYNSKYRTGFDRFWAMLIDSLVLGGVGLIFKLFNGLESLLLIGFIQIVQLMIPYLYSIILHGYCGQTVGKMLMDVKIYDKNEIELCSYKQALLRDIIPMGILFIMQLIAIFIDPSEMGIIMFISIVLSVVIVFWSILEIVTMIFDSKKRALHDYIAGTVVLKLRA